jgi:hypothetical protein
MIGAGQIEEVLVGREILDEASGDGSIRISDNHFGRFHFLPDLGLVVYPKNRSMFGDDCWQQSKLCECSL